MPPRAVSRSPGAPRLLGALGWLTLPRPRLRPGRWWPAWLALALVLGVGAFLLLDVARAAIYLTVGKAYANRGNLERAITVYSAALELKPRVSSREWLTIAYGYRGTAFLDKGEPSAAIDDLKQALVLNPEQPIYQERLMLGQVRRGESRLEGGELEGAIADLEAALRVAPQHPSAPRSLALAYARRGLQRAERGQIAPALEDLTRALELQPLVPEHLAARAQVLAQGGRHQAALADYTRALEQASSWPAYYGRGRSLFALGRHAEASADYVQARSLLAGLPEGEERARGTGLVTAALEELRRVRPRSSAP